MIYILHGDDAVSSRKRATELFKNVSTTVSLDGKNLKEEEIAQSLVTQSLFGESYGVLIDNFLLKNKQKKDIEKLLNSREWDTLVVFWESDKIRKNLTFAFKQAKVEEFKLPQNYFAFLDNLVPRSGRKQFTLYQSLLATYAAEQIFYALVKRVRALKIIKEGKESELKETAGFAPWQLSRLKSQAALWQDDKLDTFYKKLFQIEVNLKSGGLSMPLTKHLDILILSQLT